MTLRNVPAATCLLLLASLAWAHGTHEHWMGTVTEVTEKAITLKTTKEGTRTVAYDAQTRFEKSGAPAAAADLKAGERVVIEVHEVEGRPHAALVRFGPPPRPRSQ